MTPCTLRVGLPRTGAHAATGMPGDDSAASLLQTSAGRGRGHSAFCDVTPLALTSRKGRPCLPSQSHRVYCCGNLGEWKPVGYPPRCPQRSELIRLLSDG